MSRLRVDAGTIEVLDELDRWGVRPILLKGRAIADWLYADQQPRTYSDCDLLIGPNDARATEEALTALGFRSQYEERAMPTWWREHACAWFRARDGLWMDVHHTLPGISVDDAQAWRVLSTETEPAIVAGRQVSALSLPARALHIALHAAQHGVAWPRPLNDLNQAIALDYPTLWEKALALAERLGAVDALAAGLGMTEAGAALARRLGLPPVSSVEAQLRAASPPPLALGFEQLAQADGLHVRLEIIARKLIPPRTFVEHWDPRAKDSRRALVRAYLRRPLWLLQQAPDGFRAWHEARRAVRSPSAAPGELRLAAVQDNAPDPPPSENSSDVP